MVISEKPISCSELMKRFPQFFIDFVGSLDREIIGVSSPESAKSRTAVFLATPKALAKGLDSSAEVLVIPKKFRAEAEAKLGSRTLLIANNVERAMANVVSECFLKTPYTNRAYSDIHPTAIIGAETRIASGVRIGPYAVIGESVKLAAGVFIGAHAVVEDACVIEEESVIHPHAYIGHSTRIGRRCEVHPQSVVGKEGFGYAHDEKGNHYRIPHQGYVVLEDDVHIGACCTIDRATFGETRIETGTKFDNQIHIAHNCRVGKNALLTAGFTMAGSSRIGANFVTGGKTVVTGHIEVADNVQLAALTAVSKSIDKPGQYGGNPLQPLQQFIKTKAAMTQLPDLRKKVNRILKHLGLDEEAAGPQPEA